MNAASVPDATSDASVGRLFVTEPALPAVALDDDPYACLGYESAQPCGWGVSAAAHEGGAAAGRLET